MTNASPFNGPDIQNVSFEDNAAIAFAGLNIANTNGFNVSNSGFTGFFPGSTTAAFADPQGGAGIVLTGGQISNQNASPNVQFGTVINNHINASIGITSKFSVSSVNFHNNSIQCASGPGSVGTGSIGLDIGGLWYLNYYNSANPTPTGGENRVINQQNQGCLVGTLLGYQQNDRVETKLENNISGGGGASCNVSGRFGATSSLCTLGLAVLNTTDSLLFNQTKKAVSGLYIDTTSTHNTVYENRTGGPLTTGNTGTTLNNLCPSASCVAASYSFTSASLVVDSAAAPTTAIFGTPSGGTFAPTGNSAFTTDNEPSGLNVTVAGSNVGLTVTGDGSGSNDVLDVNTNGGLSGNALKIATGGAVTAGFGLTAATLTCSTQTSCLSGSAPGTAVTIGGNAVTGTNTTAGDLILDPSIPTGNAGPSHVLIKGPALSATSGTSSQSLVNRYAIHGKTGLTSNVATNILGVIYGMDTSAALWLTIHVQAQDTTNNHSCSTIAQYPVVLVNANGTLSQMVGTAVGTTTLCDTGSLTISSVTASNANPSFIAVKPLLTGFTATTMWVTTEVVNLSQQSFSFQ